MTTTPNAAQVTHLPYLIEPELEALYGCWITQWEHSSITTVLWGFPDGENLTVVVMRTSLRPGPRGKNNEWSIETRALTVSGDGSSVNATIDAYNNVATSGAILFDLLIRDMPRYHPILMMCKLALASKREHAELDIPKETQDAVDTLVSQSSQPAFQLPNQVNTHHIRLADFAILVSFDPTVCNTSAHTESIDRIKKYQEVSGPIIASPQSPLYAEWLQHESEVRAQAIKEQARQHEEAKKQSLIQGVLQQVKPYLKPEIKASSQLCSDEQLCLLMCNNSHYCPREPHHPALWSWGLVVAKLDDQGNLTRLRNQAALEQFASTAWREQLRTLMVLRDVEKSYGWSQPDGKADLIFQAICEAAKRGQLYASSDYQVLSKTKSKLQDSCIRVEWRGERREQWAWHRVHKDPEGSGYLWKAQENNEAIYCSCFGSGSASIEMPVWGENFWIRRVNNSKDRLGCKNGIFVPDAASRAVTKEILETGAFLEPLPNVEVRHTTEQPQAMLSYQGDGKVKAVWSYQGSEIPASTKAVANTKCVIEHERGFLVVERQPEVEQQVLRELSEKTGLSVASLSRGTVVRKNAAAGAVERQLRQWQQEGIQISGAPELARDIIKLEPEELDLEIDEKQGWFSFSSHIDIQGKRVDLVPVIAMLIQREGGFDALADRSDEYPIEWELEDGRLASIALGRLREMIHWIEQFFGLAAPRRLSQAEALGAMLAVEAQSALSKRWRAPDVLAQQVAFLREGKDVALPAHPIMEQLRPYQKESLAWALNLFQANMGGLLADEMGLGKTIQSIAIMLSVKQQGKAKPHLVLCPLSVTWNWARELQRFAPELRVAVIGRTDSTTRDWEEAAAQADVIVCPFSLALADQEQLLKMSFAVCVIDEAHALRNPRTQTYKVVAAISAQHRLALTGTPLQNHPLDLWAIFSLLVPGLLGDLESFQKAFNREQVSGFARRMRTLAAIVAPFTKRRRKQDVDLQLPPLEIVTKLVSFSEDQADVYESMRAATFLQADSLIQSQGIKNSHIELLAALTRLRQLCCDPKLVDKERFADVSSAKVEALMEMLEELREEGRRPLIFSSFVSLLQLVAEQMRSRGFTELQLTGQTVDRKAVVESFEAGNGDAFLISLKAGGVGLNLTSADTVILLDPWWNPAMEAQAIGRAHRHGQTKNVTVFKLITRGTIEERIQVLQARKEMLADIALREDKEGQALALDTFNEELIHNLLAPEAELVSV